MAELYIDKIINQSSFGSQIPENKVSLLFYIIWLIYLLKCLKYAPYEWFENFTIFPYDNI